MARFSFTTDLPDRVGDDIEDAITKGIAKGLREIAEEGRDASESNARADDLRFMGELITSFEIESDSNSATIRNTSNHAAPQEYGVSGVERARDTPLAYTDEKPPLSDLIPWVQAHLTMEAMGSDDYDGDFDPWNRYYGPDAPSRTENWQGWDKMNAPPDAEPSIDGEDAGGGDGQQSAVDERTDDLLDGDSQNELFNLNASDDRGMVWEAEDEKISVASRDGENWRVTVSGNRLSDDEVLDYPSNDPRQILYESGSRDSAEAWARNYIETVSDPVPESRRAMSGNEIPELEEGNYIYNMSRYSSEVDHVNLSGQITSAEIYENHAEYYFTDGGVEYRLDVSHEQANLVRVSDDEPITVLENFSVRETTPDQTVFGLFGETLLLERHLPRDYDVQFGFEDMDNAPDIGEIVYAGSSRLEVLGYGDGETDAVLLVNTTTENRGYYYPKLTGREDESEFIITAFPSSDENDGITDAESGSLPDELSSELLYRGDDDGFLWEDANGDWYVGYETRDGWWSFSSAYEDVGYTNTVGELQDSHIFRASSGQELANRARSWFSNEEDLTSLPERELPEGFRSVYDWQFTRTDDFFGHEKLVASDPDWEEDKEIWVRNIWEDYVEFRTADETGSMINEHTWTPENDTKIIGRSDQTLATDLSQGDYVITEEYDDIAHEDVYRFYHIASVSGRDRIAYGDSVFDETYPSRQIDEENLIGTREEHPDIWGEGVELTEPLDSIPEDHIYGDPGVTHNMIHSDRPPEFVVNDGGDLYKTTPEYDLSTGHGEVYLTADNPTVDGDEIRYTYDYENNELQGDGTIESVEQRAHSFLNLNDEQDILFDNRGDGTERPYPDWPNGILKGSVDGFRGGSERPIFRRQYIQHAHFNDSFGYDNYFGSRENHEIPWTVSSLDPGDEIVVDGEEVYATGKYEGEVGYVLDEFKYITDDGTIRTAHSTEVEGIVSRSGTNNYTEALQDSQIPDNYERDFWPKGEDSFSEGEVVFVFDNRSERFKELTVKNPGALSVSFYGDKPYRQEYYTNGDDQDVAFPVTVLGRREEIHIPETQYIAPMDINDALGTDLSPGDKVTFNEWDKPGEVQSVFSPSDRAYRVEVEFNTEDGSRTRTLATNANSAVVIETGNEVDELNIINRDNNGTDLPDSANTDYDLDNVSNFSFMRATDEGDEQGAFWMDNDTGESFYLNERDGNWRLTLLPAESTPDTTPEYTLSDDARQVLEFNDRQEALTQSKEYLNGIYDDPLPEPTTIRNSSGYDIIEAGDYVKIQATSLHAHNEMEQGEVVSVDDSRITFKYSGSEYTIHKADSGNPRIRSDAFDFPSARVQEIDVYKPQSGNIIGFDQDSDTPFIPRHLRDGWQGVPGFSSTSDAPDIGSQVYITENGYVKMLEVTGYETPDGRAAIVLEDEFGTSHFYYPTMTGREEESDVFVVGVPK